MMDSVDALRFRVTMRLEDLVALQIRCMASPAMRAGIWRRRVLALVVFTLLSPVFLILGALASWLEDRDGSPQEAIRFVLWDHPQLVLTAAAIMAGCVAVQLVINAWTLRSRMRRVLRRTLRTRPDVDRTDPTLAYTAEVIAGADGLETRSAVGGTLLRWAAFEHWDEEDGRIMVLGDGLSGFCLPIAELADDVVQRFRAILAAHLGPPTATARIKGAGVSP